LLPIKDNFKRDYTVHKGDQLGSDFYNVGKMKQTNTNEVQYDPLLPTHPFFITAVGPRHTGKSNCMVDLVVNKITPGFFDLIIIYCKTIHDDDKWEALTQDHVGDDMIRTEYSEEQISADYETVCQMKAQNPGLRSLMIFDDMIADNVSNKFKVDKMGQLAAMGRHKGISVLFATQFYKALAPLIRTNTTHLLVFFQSNGQEFNSIQEANCAHMNKKTFTKIYQEVFEDLDPRHHEGERPFLQVNNTKPLKDRYWKNWNVPIKIDGMSTEETDLGGAKIPNKPQRKRKELDFEESDSGPEIVLDESDED